jgi:hypothetical protein
MQPFVNLPCIYELDVYFRIYKAGRAIVPGYTGHIPGMKQHGAGKNSFMQ